MPEGLKANVKQTLNKLMSETKVKPLKDGVNSEPGECIHLYNILYKNYF